MLNKIIISPKNLIHNLQQFRHLVGPKVKIMAMIKANAYGHGLKQIAPIVEKKADWLGVNNLGEGLVVRQLGIKLPALILGYVPLVKLNQVVKNNLSLGVYNRQTINHLPVNAKVHLKIETGTNRQGIRPNNVPSFIKLCQQKKLKIEGIYTHFANAEENSAFTKKQLKSLLSTPGVSSLRHAACSAAAIRLSQSHLDMVRIGVGLYGLWSTKSQKIKLKPVLSWYTKIAQIKTVAKDETVGYGRTWRALRNSKIAILPVGYYDGFDRKLSNCGRVLIHGQFAPVVGRICMNMMMVDVTKIPNAKLEDKVILIGQQDKNQITVDELAKKTDTINYEIISRLNPKTPRLVI